jgi:ribosomal-protein-alanine N-acetyltransferase
MTDDEDITFEIRKLQGEGEARECARLMAGSEPWITLRRTYDDSLRMMRDPSREVYVALVDDELVGFAIIRMSGAFVGYIQTIGLKPQWRNKGLGRRFLAFIEQRVFKEAPNVFMCVSSFNTQAQKLYARLGYEVVGELKDYIVAGHSEILLRKTIAPLADFGQQTGPDN